MSFPKIILISVVLIIIDLFVYLVLGLLLMNYDDFYDESEGEYWSLESMTPSEKFIYIGLQVWHILNLLAAAYIIYRIVGLFKKRTTKLRT